MQSAVSRPKILIQMFGPLEVFRDGEKMKPADFGSRKAKTLLRWLADARNDTVSENILFDALWPDTPQDQVMRSFRVRVSEVRKLLAPDKRSEAPLERIENGYILRTIPGRLETDVDHFVTYTSEALQMPPGRDAVPFLEQSIKLYKDDYYSDDPYIERWYGPRERYRKQFVAVAKRLAAIYEFLGQYAEGIHLLQDLLNKTHPDEGLYQALIRLQYLHGDQAGALRTFDECRTYLQSEIGTRPLPETWRLLKQVIRHEPLDPLPFLNVDQMKSIASDHPSIPNVDTPWPFLGRQAELDQLKRCVSRLQEGQGGIVWIHGLSGIGKTRLMKEAINDTARHRRIHTLWIQGSYLNSRIPFAATVDGLQTGLDPGLCSEQLDGLIATISPQVRQLIGWFTHAISAEQQSASSGLEPIDDLLLHQEMLTFFEGFTRQMPLIICVDDVQALDPASLSLLLALGRRVKKWPLLIVMTCQRSPEEDELGNDLQKTDSLMTTISLEPLSASALTPLAGRGMAALWSQRWLRQLHTETSGEPYMLIQKLHQLKRKNLIDVVGGEIVFPTGLFELMTVAPTTDEEQKSFSSRQDDFHRGWQELNDDARALLQKAAILRDSLSLERLERMASKSTTNFQRVFEQLIRQGFFTINGLDPAGNPNLTFAHGRLQHRTYHTMTPSERLWHHRQVFEMLQDEWKDLGFRSAIVRTRMLSAIAEHALMAENWEAAAKWSLKAATAAKSIMTGPEVATLCRQALQAAKQTESPSRKKLLYQARLALGEALFQIGSHAQALPIFEILAQTADANNLLTISQPLMTIYLHLNHFDKARTLVDGLLAQAGDKEAIRIRSNLSKANIHYRKGEATESIALAQKVLDDIQSQSSVDIDIPSTSISNHVYTKQRSQAIAHHQLAISYWDLGEYGHALDHARQCVDIRRGQDELGLISSLNVLGELYQDLFCTDLALEVHRSALDLSLTRGKVSYSIEIWRNIGLSFVHEGRMKKGLQTLERAWQQVRDLRLAPYSQEHHLRSLLEANILAHRPREVRTLLDLYKQALGPRETPFVPIFTLALAFLEGRVDEGEEMLSHVRAFWDQTGRRARAAHVLLFVGQELMLQGHNEWSQKHLTLAAREMERICALVPLDIARRIRASRQYSAAQRLLRAM